MPVETHIQIVVQWQWHYFLEAYNRQSHRSRYLGLPVGQNQRWLLLLQHISVGSYILLLLRWQYYGLVGYRNLH